MCPETIPFVWLPKSDFKLSLQTTNSQPCGPVHNSSWSGRKGMDDNSMRGSKVLGPHLKPLEWWEMWKGSVGFLGLSWLHFVLIPQPESLCTYPFCLQLSFFLRSRWRNRYKTSFDLPLWVSGTWQDFSVLRALKKVLNFAGKDEVRIQHLLWLFIYLFFLLRVLFPFLSPSCEIWFIANCATPWKLWVPSTFHGFKS